MAKKLKYWNGRPHGIFLNRTEYPRAQMNVAAYSQKQASEILIAASSSHVTTSEIAEYYSPCWGNDMIGVETTEPGVWVVYRNKQNTETIRKQVYPVKL